MNVEITDKALWRVRDLIHHFGVHHPAVQGTQAGMDLAILGNHIPDLINGGKLSQERLREVFHRYGWDDQEISLESVLDLADSLMLPPFDPSARLEWRRRQTA